MIYFFIAETMGFVDKLFECLTTKNYLGNPPAKETPKEEVKQPPVKSDVVEVRSWVYWLHLDIEYKYLSCDESTLTQIK